MAVVTEELKLANEKQHAQYTKELETIKEHGPQGELLLAAKYGDHKGIAELLNQGITVDFPATIDIISKCFKAFRVPNTIILLGESLPLDSTALMIASKFGHLDAVRVLIERGANVNQTNAGGLTALMYAAKEGFPDIVKCLLANKADMQVVSSLRIPAHAMLHYNHNKTALHLAVESLHVEVVQILLEHLALVIEPLIQPLKRQILEIKSQLVRFFNLDPDLKKEMELLEKTVCESNLLNHAKELLSVIEKIKKIASSQNKYSIELEKIDSLVSLLNLKVKELESKKVQLESLKNILEIKGDEQVLDLHSISATPLQSVIGRDLDQPQDFLESLKHRMKKKEDKEKDEERRIKAAQKRQIANQKKEKIAYLLIKSGCSMTTKRLSKSLDETFVAELNKRTELEFYRQTGKTFISDLDIKKFKEIRADLTGCVQMDPLAKKGILSPKRGSFSRFSDLPVDTHLQERYKVLNNSSFLPERMMALVLAYDDNTTNPHYQEAYSQLHQARLLTLYTPYQAVKSKEQCKHGKFKCLKETSRKLLNKLKGSNATVQYGFELEVEREKENNKITQVQEPSSLTDNGLNRKVQVD